MKDQHDLTLETDRDIGICTCHLRALQTARGAWHVRNKVHWEGLGFHRRSFLGLVHTLACDAGVCGLALALPCAAVPHRARLHEPAGVGPSGQPPRQAAPHAHHHPLLPCRQLLLQCLPEHPGRNAGMIFMFDPALEQKIFFPIGIPSRACCAWTGNIKG